jgi:hypothetical protein
VNAAPDDSLLEADWIMRLARIRLPIVEKGSWSGCSPTGTFAASISRLGAATRGRMNPARS